MAVGEKSMEKFTSGGNAVGYESAEQHFGMDNTAVGYEAMDAYFTGAQTGCLVIVH